MKRFFLITTLLSVLAFIVLGVLDYMDIIRITWAPLIIAFTAVTPILKLISNWFSKPNETGNQLKKIHFNNGVKLSSNQGISNSRTEPKNIQIEAMKNEIIGLRAQVKTLEEYVRKNNDNF